MASTIKADPGMNQFIDLSRRTAPAQITRKVKNNQQITKGQTEARKNEREGQGDLLSGQEEGTPGGCS